MKKLFFMLLCVMVGVLVFACGKTPQHSVGDLNSTTISSDKHDPSHGVGTGETKGLNSDYEPESIPETMIPASLGLEYTINRKEKSVTIIGIGSCKDSYIVIPASVEGYPVVGVRDKAFKENDNIEGVVIPGCVEYIGEEAFSYCENLMYVEIMSNNGMVIQSYAFANCYNLEYLRMGDGLSEIESYAFNCCSSLVEVVIPEGKNGILVEIDDTAFYRCKWSTTIYVPQYYKEYAVDYMLKKDYGDVYYDINYYDPENSHFFDVEETT